MLEAEVKTLSGIGERSDDQRLRQSMTFAIRMSNGASR
jgi:hypothetical protein